MLRQSEANNASMRDEVVAREERERLLAMIRDLEAQLAAMGNESGGRLTVLMSDNQRLMASNAELTAEVQRSR